jgi:hypothetical protein
LRAGLKGSSIFRDLGLYYVFCWTLAFWFEKIDFPLAGFSEGAVSLFVSFDELM